MYHQWSSYFRATDGAVGDESSESPSSVDASAFASSFLFGVDHRSAKPLQTMVNNTLCSALPNMRVLSPRQRRPLHPSSAKMSDIASPYETACRDPMDCLVVFITRIPFETTSDTTDALNPMNAFFTSPGAKAAATNI